MKLIIHRLKGEVQLSKCYFLAQNFIPTNISFLLIFEAKILLIR